MLRKHFNAQTALTVVALVFAMTGGAYAAKKFLITSTKQISPSVLKALAGKAGAAGAQGPAGPAGSQGPAGANGKDGVNGKDGLEGKVGKDGVSVTDTAFKGNEEPQSEPCKEQGGTEFVSSSGTTYACNGTEGSPWTAGGTLPSGKTETGRWSIAGPQAAGAFKPAEGFVTTYIPLSFPIPLAGEVEIGHVHVYLPGETPAEGSGCFGGTVANPTAEKGNLCVYTGAVNGSAGAKIEQAAPVKAVTSGFLVPGATGAGSVLKLVLSLETSLVAGSWAVTAE